MRVPVVLLGSTEAVERDAAILSALLDVPGLVVITYDLHGEDGDEPAVRRVVTDSGGVRQDVGVLLDHLCLGCMMQEDAVPAIAELGEEPIPGVLLALPLGVEIYPAVQSLLGHMGPGGELDGFRLGATVVVTTSTGVAEQLDDADEELLTQLVEADVVVISDGDSRDASEVGGDLADALRWSASRRFDELCGSWLDQALRLRHDPQALERRADPASAEPGRGVNACELGDDGTEVAASGVWRLVLHSDRPLHPDRLMADIELLGGAGAISRGRFRVANRPDALCDWQAVGGSVRIGTAGRVSVGTDTRLVVVGHGRGHREIREAFGRALVTDAEQREGPSAWFGRPDPLLPYLGEPADLYRSGEAPG